MVTDFEFLHACPIFEGLGWVKTEDGWGVTYHIPFTFIRLFFPDFKAYEGLKFYGNFYRSGEKAASPFGMSWNPIDPSGTTFHCPAFYGQLILGGE